MKELIKTARIPILLFLAVILSELLLWNIFPVISMFYQEINLAPQNWEGAAIRQEDGSYLLPDGILTVTIPDINKRIYNMHLDLVPLSPAGAVGEDGLVQSVSYVIWLSDEGNYYPYELPAGIIVEGVRATEFTDIHTSGKVKDIQIAFTAPENTVVGNMVIRANVRLPFVFSLFRMVFLYLVLIIGWLLLSGKALAQSCRAMGKKRIVAVIVLLSVLLIGCYQLAVLNPAFVRPTWPHHRQYQELAELIVQGKVVFDDEPPLEMINAENPYDTIWLQAQGVSYRADYAYYNGRYYVYFGIVPELLLYLPFYMILDLPLPNYFAVFLLFSGFMLMVFALYREVIRRFFPDTPPLIWLLVSFMTVILGSHIFLIKDPDLYKVPITAALMFTAAGFVFWLKALGGSGVKKRVLLAVGSLCMALVAGCRPQMLLYSGLAILILREKKLLSWGSWRDKLAFGVPYLAVAAGIMYYNWIRFGSVFDFGATYSLTSNDMTKRRFDLEQTLQGLHYYFFQLPLIDTVFPFIRRDPVETGYMGKLNAEYVYGGLMTSNAFIWFTGFLPSVGKRLREKGLSLFVWTAMAVSVALAVTDITYAGILQRYMADFTWGFGLAAGIVALAWTEQMMESAAQQIQEVKEELKVQQTAKKMHMSLPKVFLGILVLQGLYSFYLIFGGAEGTFGLKNMAPQVFYRISSWF